MVNLGVRGYDVVEAPDGEAALERAAADHPDLVLLDLGLPTIDGLSVLEALRRWSDVPVIVLTARDDERTKVRALTPAPTITSPSRSAWANCSPASEQPCGELPTSTSANRCWTLTGSRST